MSSYLFIYLFIYFAPIFAIIECGSFRANSPDGLAGSVSDFARNGFEQSSMGAMKHAHFKNPIPQHF